MSRAERDGTPDPHPRRAAADLGPHERVVASWLAALPRADTGAHVRQRLLTHAAGTAPAGRTLRLRGLLGGRLWTRPALPLLAMAACAVLAVGVVMQGGSGSSLPAPPGQAPSQADASAGGSALLAGDVATRTLAAAQGPEGGEDAAPLILLDDPRLGLMHGLETFDRIGFQDAELVADWGR